MDKIINTGGNLFKKNRKGEAVRVESFMAATNDTCDCTFVCCGDTKAIQFIHSELGKVQIPLQQLYNHLLANNIVDTVAPASPTTLASGTITSESIVLTWVDGTDTNYDGVKVYLDGVFVADVASGVQTYTFIGLDQSTSYTLGLRSKDIADNLSTIVTLTESTIALAPVTSLATGTITTTTIPTTWVDSIATNVASLSLRIAATGVTPVEVSSGTPAALAQAYTFTGLTTATGYDIAVIATDTIGNESVAATLTNVVTA